MKTLEKVSNMHALQTTDWYMYLTPWQRELVDTSAQLLELFSKPNSSFQSASINVFPDYGFIVFSMAKAYEGFLKKYFLNLGLITPDLYNSRKFRVGRAFNPDVNQNQKNELWIYDDVARACGQDVARELWEAWLSGRNQVFHYFPDEKGKLSLEQAEKKITQMNQAMAQAINCSIAKERLAA